MGKGVIDRLVNLFPFLVLVVSGLALYSPEFFLWFKPFIAYGLAVVMLSMGMTLSLDDFKRVIVYPKWVLSAIFLQFTVMPLLGWSLGIVFDLPKPLAVGLIIMSCCPGGTASNVITYLARANVALSVTMTAVSTLAAIVLTPLLTTFLIGNKVEVSALSLFIGTAKVVLVPVLAGILLNYFTPKVTKKLSIYSPLLAIVALNLIIGSVVGDDREVIFNSGLRLILVVFILHISGFILGFLLAFILTKNHQTSRTTAIEVGMQNSGLGAVLAKTNFPALQGIGAPSAVASSVHNIVASFFVWVFRNWKTSESDHSTEKTTL